MRPDTQEAADLSVYVTMFKDTVQVFRDVSGTSLHRRGYRGVIHKASLNEAAAAGMLYTAGWPQLAKEGTSLTPAGLVHACWCVLHEATGHFLHIGSLSITVANLSAHAELSPDSHRQVDDTLYV